MVGKASWGCHAKSSRPQHVSRLEQRPGDVCLYSFPSQPNFRGGREFIDIHLIQTLIWMIMALKNWGTNLPCLTKAKGS